MTIEEIMVLVDQTLEIDQGNLGSEALRQIKIFSTIQKLYVNATRELESANNNFEKVKNHRYRYYAGKCTAEEYKKEPLREAVLKGDIDNLLKIDNTVLEMKSILTEKERIVKYLEEAKKQLSDRGYMIRLSLDFQKFQLGI